MHRVTIYGKTPGSLALLTQLLRERQNLCQLEWFQLLVNEKFDEPGYTGPVSAAQPGLYEIWHDAPGTKDGFFLVDLVVLEDQLMIGSDVIQRQRQAEFVLDKSTTKSFRDLLGQSEKLLVVYQRGINHADRQYMMVWPDHVKHLVPEKDGYKLLGIANLDTGVISATAQHAAGQGLVL